MLALDIISDFMTPEQALVRLRRMCSKCEHSTGQIRRRLEVWDNRERMLGRQGFSSQQMTDIIASLVQERFVDDVRFAGAYVRDKARFAKWGPAKIKYNLKMLGVEEGVIKDALEENGEMFVQDALRELAVRKWKSMKQETDVYMKRAKLVRFLVGRGFSYSQIMEFMKDLG